MDPFGNTDTAYRGTVALTANDPRGSVAPGQYTFAAADAGVHAFTATLKTPGTRTLTATDAAHGLTGAELVVVKGVPPDVIVGTAGGSTPTVNVFTAGGSYRTSFTPTDPAFATEVRTAGADFDGDGVTDWVLGSGPGTSSLVLVQSGATGQVLFRLQPFESTFTGGVFVAAGDVTGDGIPELVVTADEGGGPRVLVYDGNTFGLIADFYGIDDPNFRGGARAAVGDINADGFGDLVVAAGFEGGPRVAAFDGKSLVQNHQFNHLFNDFFIFGGTDAETLRNGVFIAAGDLNGDGYADLIAGGGPGGGPRVLAVDGASLLRNGPSNLVQLANFYGGDPGTRDGIRVTTKDLDGDNKADIVVGTGVGTAARMTWYRGATVTPTGTPPAYYEFGAFQDAVNGVYVG